MDLISARVEGIVLSVHRRNGGCLERLDFNLRLLDPALGLDSLDLAEIVASIEKTCNGSPFDSPSPPRTWAELIMQLPKEDSAVGPAQI